MYLVSSFCLLRGIGMKKILFAVNNMNINGIKTSLLNLLSSINLSEYEITIFMFEKCGLLLKELPDYCNVVCFDEFSEIKEMAYLPFALATKKLFEKKQYFKLLSYTIVEFVSRVIKNKGILYHYLFQGFPKIDASFDYAMSYFGPLDVLSYYVLNEIRANNKIQWVHFDINEINFDKKFAKKSYPKFDRMVVVSRKAQKALNDVFPHLKTECFILPTPIEKVINQSKTDTVFYRKDRFQLVTIGRLTMQKGPDIAVHISKRLKDSGFSFEWHFVGGGEMYDELTHMIKKMGLNEIFFLEGEQINPYRFLPEADLYVQPSRHEGYGLTIQEAKIIGLPIICTDFAGADEQIINGKTGVIVNLEEDELLEAIADLMLNEHKRQQFRKAVKQSLDSTQCSELNHFFKELPV